MIPKLEFHDTGIKLPTEQAILSGVLDMIDAAFGGNLNRNLDTPQGQLASSLAAIIADKNNQIAWLANQVHPDYAEGFMQDAIGKIYFIERKPATPSRVEVVFTGAVGTTIPKGFAVRDSAGIEWKLEKEISILENGTVSGSLIYDGIASAKAHTVNQIVQALNGLDRATNPQDALTGKAAESRADFRDRRQRSVAINAHGTPQAVYANVFALDGVQDVYVVDNPKGQPENIGGVVLKPHSIYCAVVGGDDTEIAETLLRYAGNGCDFNGNTHITIKDHNYTDPKPSYDVSFTRCDDLPIYFRVQIESGAPLGFDDLLKKAMLNAFNHSEFARIGSKIYAMRFVAAALSASEQTHILDVNISLDGRTWGNAVQARIDQKPTLSAENIRVTIHA